MCTLPRRGLQPNTPNTYLIIIERYDYFSLFLLRACSLTVMVSRLCT